MKRVSALFITLSLLMSLFTLGISANETMLGVGDIDAISETGVVIASGKAGKWSEGGYIGFNDVDFTGVKSVRISVSNILMYGENGETFRVYIDDPIKGKCIGYIVTNDETSEPIIYGTNIEPISGKHNLYIKHNYSRSDHIYLHDVRLSKEEWVDPKAVAPVPDSEIIDVYSDTWVATDAAGHKVADYEEAGDIKEGKHEVVMFYHDWHIHDTKAYIASEIIAKHPEAKDDFYHSAWPTNGPAFWGESVYGFYTGTDYWHYRKAAELMAASGVDAVFLDYTNGDAAYVKALTVMLRAYHDARASGVDVPKVTCYMQMGSNAEMRWNLLEAIYFNICHNEYYKDLWYYLDGKPMLVCSEPGSFYKATNPEDTEEVALAHKLTDFFTFRETGSRETGPYHEDGKYWHWLLNYPQHEWGITESGRVEMVNLGMAINHSYVYNYAGTGVFSDKYTKGKNYTEAFGEDYRPEALLEGYFLREQASKVLSVDPEIVFVDGWNEMNTARGKDYYGFPNAFIDLFDDENSRDFEPYKGALKDTYYMLLTDFCRKYKGVRPTPVASGEVSGDALSDFTLWNGAEPVFYNFYGDYERDTVGYRNYETDEHYVYKTEVKNAISKVKVLRNGENFFFNILCENDAVDYENGFMHIYINSDRNAATGWEGYDYAVNVSGKGKVSAFNGNEFTLTDIGTAEIKIDGKNVYIKLAKSLIAETDIADFEFKVTDNILCDGDLLLFYTEGNSAPVGRFNYLYTEIKGEALTKEERKALSDTTVLKAGSPKMIVDGAKMYVYEKDIRIAPFMESGTIYIPLAALDDIMGWGETKATYDWKKNVIYIKTHELTNNEITDYQWIYTYLGTNLATIDGEDKEITNPTKAVDGIIYVPITLLSECFGWCINDMGSGTFAISQRTANVEMAKNVLSHLN